MTLVTPAALVSEWTVNTMEQTRIHRRLVEAGVELVTAHDLVGVESGDGAAREHVHAAANASPLDGSSS